ncbi:hypothetical protein [Actinomadura bangladeshensis]|uniref:Uncharacterized protein n=1 Tax=Actinomadura bangladeshensis TaxID=453573 RepID=A0A4V2XM50_9ACTN|nr:hypothetical protein [Actinomadura bangladeshensis]TDC12926.1 hypothetical protein E1284_21870 [Actinomadura bangladeshensis]
MMETEPADMTQWGRQARPFSVRARAHQDHVWCEMHDPIPLGPALLQNSSLCKELLKKGEQDAHRLFIFLRCQVSEIRPSAVLIDLAEYKERPVEFTPPLAAKSKPLMKILE